MSDIPQLNISLQRTAQLARIYDDDIFTKLVYKLIEGKELADDELAQLKAMSKTSGDALTEFDISQIRKFLQIGGSQRDTSIAAFDANPLDGRAEEANLNQKQMNLIEELKAFETRMVQVFGDTYNNSKAKESIGRILQAFDTDDVKDGISIHESADIKQAAEDEFVDRADQSVSKNTRFNDLIDWELSLVRRGVLEQLEIGGNSTAPNVTNSDADMNSTLGTGATIEDWQNHFQNVHADLPAFDQHKVEYFMRKMDNLEKLTDNDFEAMRGLLELKDQAVTDEKVQGYIDGFNTTVDNLKSLAPGSPAFNTLSPRLQANIKVNRTQDDGSKQVPVIKTKTNYKDAENRTLVEASRLLDRDDRYRSSNRALQDLETMYNTLNPQEALPGNLREKKEFLKAYVDRIFKEQQDAAIATDDDHHTKIDPDVLFEDFQNQVDFLERYANNEGKTAEERNAIKRDLLRFARGMEPSRQLKQAFKDNPQLLQAMSYFGDKQNTDGSYQAGGGYGKPRQMVGLLKAIFELPTENADGSVNQVINFNALVQRSENFEDLAVNLRNEIARSKSGNQDLEIPVELLTSSEDKEVHVLTALENLQSQKTKGKEGQTIETHNYRIFRQLDFDVSNIEFDPAKDPEDIGRDVYEHKKLFDLLKHFVDLEPGQKKEVGGEPTEALYKAVGRAVQLAYGSNSEDYEDAQGPLPDGGKRIAGLILGGLQKVEKEFLDYDGYDAASSGFKSIKDVRQELIAFSDEHNLGFYKEDEMLSVYHENEYEEMLKDFALSFRHTEPLLRSNQSIYEIPDGLSLNYGDDSDPAEGTAITANDPFGLNAIDPSSITPAQLNNLMVQMNMIQNFIMRSVNQNLALIGNDSNTDIWGNNNNQNNELALPFYNPHLASLSLVNQPNNPITNL